MPTPRHPDLTANLTAIQSHTPAGHRRRGRRGNDEGSIYQRQDGRWVAVLSLPGGRRRSLYGRTRQEVAKSLKNAFRDRDEGRLVQGGRETVGGFLGSWFEDHAMPQLRPSTATSYDYVLRLHVIPELGAFG